MTTQINPSWIRCASRYEIFKAKLFGKKFISESEGIRQTWYIYKGVRYLVKQEKIDART